MNDISSIIDQYLNRGFGSMNKNDFEVWIFNYLLNNRFIDESNYDISIKLRIPESKVKRLRYEAELKYCDLQNEESYKNALGKILEKSILKKDGNYVQFIIEKIQLRKYLDSILKKDGRFTDSSFNSEIVTIDVDDFEYLVEIIWPGENWKAIYNLANMKLNNKSSTFKDIFKSFCKGIGTQTGKNIVNLTFSGILELVKSLI